MRFRTQTRSSPGPTLRSLVRSGGFALMEIAVAVMITAIGLLGVYGTVLQAGKMASAAEEEALVTSGLEQRIDQLRLLEWDDLTDGTGLTSTVWTAGPEAMAGITVSQETCTISPCDVPGTQTLEATWDGISAPAVTFTAGTALADASAVKAVATLTWTGRRSGRAQTRSLVTVISRGGISKSEHP